MLRDALAEHRVTLSGRLWEDATSAEDEDRRLRAAAALAAYEPMNPRWREIRDEYRAGIDPREARVPGGLEGHPAAGVGTSYWVPWPRSSATAT